MEVNKQPVYLCACDGNERKESCCIDPTKPNMFTKLGEIDKTLTKMDLADHATANRVEDSSTEWTWGLPKGDDCKLCYVFVYDKQGNRLPEYEIITLPNATILTLPDIPNLQVRVVALFDSKTNHGFVAIYKASSKKQQNSDLVIDLSVVRNENRKFPRSHPTHFGFLCSDYTKCEDVERVAVKKVNLTQGNESEIETNPKSVKEQIELAFEAGGQHNVKYLANTEISEGVKDIWIAMELCIKTFDVLIEKKSSSSYLIDEQRLKICFRHILKGLMHLHSKRIVHGEVKLENILLTLDGKYLKIGEYDKAKKAIDHDDYDVDVEKAGEMFLKCFRRDSKCKTDDVIDGIESEFDEKWIEGLRKLSAGLGGDGNDYMSAYLILHMLLDKPSAQEVVLHPYFWSEYKILFFIIRMHVSFVNSKSLIKSIKEKFPNSCETLYPSFDWIKKLGEISEQYCVKAVRSQLTKDTKHKTKSGNDKYKGNEITSFLYYIRNKDAHAHEKFSNDSGDGDSGDVSGAGGDDSGADGDVGGNGDSGDGAGRCDSCSSADVGSGGCTSKRMTRPYFESVSDCWKCFSNVLPGMICLLHRVVWLERKNPKLPEELRHLLQDSDSMDTLSIRTLDGENVMNYYHHNSKPSEDTQQREND